MSYEKKQLSTEEIAIFRACFNEYDQDHGGNITSEEFGRVMRKTDPNISDEDVAKIIGEVDLDGDGTINFDEFITMMTGKPYKSPEPPVEGETEADNGTPNPFQAIRGVSAMSSRLKQQRLANQVFKDAWMSVEPTLRGSITASELLLKVAPAVPGLVVLEEDIDELVDPGDAKRGIIYERFLEFAKRQENDDIFSDYAA
ncbi:unnamed protein product [Discula destructiva]